MLRPDADFDPEATYQPKLSEGTMEMLSKMNIEKDVVRRLENALSTKQENIKAIADRLE